MSFAEPIYYITLSFPKSLYNVIIKRIVYFEYDDKKVYSVGKIRKENTTCIVTTTKKTLLN